MESVAQPGQGLDFGDGLAVGAGEVRRIRSAVARYGVLALAIWTALLGGSLWWAVHRQHAVTQALALTTARAAFTKDLAYRLWASSHGGVYVEPSEKTPPSPWLAHLPDRDVTTTDGRKLTLMAPAAMLREMMQDYSEFYGIMGRIVATVALNPANQADPWEAEAIRRFQAGEAAEVVEITAIDAQSHLRLIRPFYMEQSCQKCHGHLGFANGDVRGAVGVSVPMAPYYEMEGGVIRSLAGSHAAIWGFGMAGIMLLGRRWQVRLEDKARGHEASRLAAHVFHYALDATLITDGDGAILCTNPMFTELTGYTAAEALGRNPRLLRSDHHDRDFYREMWLAISGEGRWQGEVWNRRKDGSIFVAWESIVAVKDDAGRVRYYIGSFSDITEQVEAQRHILRLAHYDVLTELPNRVLFQDRLERAVIHAKRHGRQAALLFLDLDGFKKVNDTMGHRAGDDLLKEVARRLKQCVRMTDTIARLGGDEFTVILDEIASPNDAAMVSDKILVALSLPVTVDGRDVFVGGSIGISLFPDDGADCGELLKHADIAMYQAKAAGKGRHHFYSAEMTAREERRLDLEGALRQAVEEGQLLVHYQPKLDLASREVSGFEALVRWPHPTMGMVPPSDFIPLAEEMGLVHRIDLWVMRQACRQAKAWLDAGHSFTMAVNLSGVDFRESDLVAEVRTILDDTRLPPAVLELEITETFVLDLGQSQRRILDGLKALGVGLAIDDFGTGYSSLSYLKQLPVGTLKIDRSFVRDMARDSRDMMLVGSIIGIAHSLGLKVVAEGIEEQDQMDILATQDCDQVQGYLISRPMAPEQVKIFLMDSPVATAALI
jgi:diguanylate cyclase (GGDEF)-like protein/PAS domain S-box-containing protein